MTIDMSHDAAGADAHSCIPPARPRPASWGAATGHATQRDVRLDLPTPAETAALVRDVTLPS